MGNERHTEVFKWKLTFREPGELKERKFVGFTDTTKKDKRFSGIASRPYMRPKKKELLMKDANKQNITTVEKKDVIGKS
jgi:hypothetical protein